MPNDCIVKTLTPISESRLCADPEFERAESSELRAVKRETKKFDSVKRRCRNAGSLFCLSVRLSVKILPSRNAGTVLPVADSVILSYCIVYIVCCILLYL